MRRRTDCNHCTLQRTPGTSCSFEHLIRAAVRHGLVTTYEESPTLIRLHIAGHVIEMDPPHARMLLCNRLWAAGVAVLPSRPEERAPGAAAPPCLEERATAFACV